MEPHDDDKPVGGSGAGLSLPRMVCRMCRATAITFTSKVTDCSRLN